MKQTRQQQGASLGMDATHTTAAGTVPVTFIGFSKKGGRK